MLNNSINENPPSYEEVCNPNSQLETNITLIEQPLQTNITLTEQPKQQSTIENENESENPTNDKCLPDCCYDQEGKLDVPSGICTICNIVTSVPCFFILYIASCGCCGNIWLPNK